MISSSRNLIFLFLLFLLPACSSLPNLASSTATPSPTLEPTAVPTLTPGWAQSETKVKLEHLTGGLRSALQIVSPPDNTGRLFILQKKGVIRIVENGTLIKKPFLDIHENVARKGEQALQGLAFAPDFNTSGLFYIFYNRLADNHLVLERYQISADPSLADLSSATEILKIPHPTPVHNGGQLLFGQDGYLYFSVGDGTDPTKGFSENGQKLDTLLGKILRIDVSTTPYTIPPTNPFVNDPQARPEIFAYGFRNPWRFTIDDETGNLFIADVGEKAWEEVNVLPLSDAAGKNFGWSRMEGTHCFSPKTNCQNGTLQLPVFEYPHAYGCAIVGGMVYRGTKIPQLTGKYLFGDFCLGCMWTLEPDGTNGWRAAELGLFDIRIGAIVAAQDENIYVLDYKKGQLYRLVAE